MPRRNAHRSDERNGSIARLASLFAQNGTVRTGPRDLASPGHRGYEIRFGASVEGDAREIARLLRVIGIKPGKPFAHGPNFRVPVYGREQVRRLLTLIAPSEIEAAGLE